MSQMSLKMKLSLKKIVLSWIIDNVPINQLGKELVLYLREGMVDF